MSRLILVIMTLTLVVTVAGCNRFPDLSIQVTANLQPGAFPDCSVSDDQTEVLPTGLLDFVIIRDYVVTPRIESYIVSNALEFQGEQGNIEITSFSITILLPDGTQPVLAGDLPNPYSVATSAFIPVNNGAGSTARAAFAVAIPTSYRDALLAIVADTGFEQISIDIRANGTTTGGFSQTSPPFRWPILFCNGCLGVTCEEPAELGDAVGCFAGQDSGQYCAEITVPPGGP